MGELHQSTFSVPADHPSLPGHFPGTPVVPGVVVLDVVLKTSEAWRGPLEVTGLRQVKFHAPLLPTESAEVVLDLEGNALAFRVTRGDQVIAQGSFIVEESSIHAGGTREAASGQARS
jgi:3-hydroxymyristoyl/3-hydroxydecanoyl-(acyl carrier protein) dehydratase